VRSGVEVELVSEPTIVMTDQTLLLRMIDNVTLNAIKYSHSNQLVTLELKDNQLSIIDRGRGIKEPSRVFEKFYRDSKSANGIGIGLFVVKIISEKLGVDIAVESEVDVGTTFRFDLSSIKQD
jgi:signal transduction histidine kinase